MSFRLLKKKLTRKQFLKQPDEFHSITSWVVNFAKKQAVPVLIGIGAFLAAILLSGGFFIYQGQVRERVSVLEAEALSAYHGPAHTENTPPTAEQEKERYKTAKAKFQEILDKYPNSSNARQTLLYVGTCNYQLGEYEDAQKIYKRFLDKYPQVDNYYKEALYNLGYSLEASGDYQKAAQTYEQLIAVSSEQEKLINYPDLARAYEHAGDWPKAALVYETMLAQSKEPAMKNMIEGKLQNARLHNK